MDIKNKKELDVNELGGVLSVMGYNINLEQQKNYET